MTATITRVLPLSEVATVLRARLGNLRAWYPFLVDNIRGRQDVCGFQLLPCGMQQDGRALRPVYALAAVEEFIGHVLAALPSAGKEPITPTTLLVDCSRPWRRNRFDRYGAPVAMLRASHHGCVRSLARSIRSRANRSAVSAMILAY
jgi:hypothetical protein